MKEYFKIAIKNLKARQLRSYLTILGILIGVFLIVTLLSLSEGLKQAILAQLRMYGKEILYIFPGSFEDISSIMGMFLGRFEIEPKALERIEKIEGIEKVVPLDYKAEIVRYENKSKVVLIFSYPREKGQELFRSDVGWKLIKGDWPKSEKREALVGRLVPIEIFPGLEAGDKIYIKGKEFLVTGILQSLGSKQDDSMIEIDWQDFKEITGYSRGSPWAVVKIKSNENPETMASKIRNVLEEFQKRKIGSENLPFSVLTNEKVGSIASSILLIIQIMVGAFASIAIIVGGIGIMNTMFTSVRERTREIGIMKAIGAKNSEISLIFLIESSIMGLTGGILGTLCGIFFAKVIEYYGQAHNYPLFKASITPGLLFFGLLFSLSIGCISGILPARRAASLKPVDALRRYE